MPPDAREGFSFALQYLVIDFPIAQFNVRNQLRGNATLDDSRDQ